MGRRARVGSTTDACARRVRRLSAWRARRMALTIRDDGRGRRYVASEVARAVVRVGGRIWLGTLVVALGCLLLRLGADLSPRTMELTRSFIGLPIFLALAVPLSWLAYRFIPCSCVIDMAQFHF